MAAVAPPNTAPFSDSGKAKGSPSNVLPQCPADGASGSTSTGCPAATLLARATAAARSPVRRTSADDSRGLAAKPQAEPTSARTPRPVLSPASTSSTSPSCARRLSLRVATTRASAYRAPAARAASTAAWAASNIRFTLVVRMWIAPQMGLVEGSTSVGRARQVDHYERENCMDTGLLILRLALGLLLIGHGSQ